MQLYTGLIELNWTSLMVLANVVILYLILKRFFFEKIHNFMQARQDAVKDAFDSAEAVNRKADEKMSNYNLKIAKVEEESREIIAQAKQKAEVQAKEIVKSANLKANDMMLAAEREIERERQKALSEMKQQIVVLAMLAAEKIVEKDIEIIGQEKIVDQIIEEAGKSGWQN